MTVGGQGTGLSLHPAVVRYIPVQHHGNRQPLPSLSLVQLTSSLTSSLYESRSFRDASELLCQSMTKLPPNRRHRSAISAAARIAWSGESFPVIGEGRVHHEQWLLNEADLLATDEVVCRERPPRPRPKPRVLPKADRAVETEAGTGRTGPRRGCPAQKVMAQTPPLIGRHPVFGIPPAVPRTRLTAGPGPDSLRRWHAGRSRGRGAGWTG